MSARAAEQISRLYEQTLAAEYRSWADAALRADPGCGLVVERLGWRDGAPAVVVAGPEGALINETLGLGFDGEPDADGTAARVVAAFARARSDTALVELSPYAEDGLAAALARQGFVYASSLHVMFRELEVGTGSIAAAAPGVLVRRVDHADPGQVAAAAGLIARAKTPTGHGVALDPRALTMATQIVQCPRVATFVAEVDGTPAGGASAGVWREHPLSPAHVNLYNAGTLAEHRGRGVQSALLAARLAWAAAEGAVTASLDCRPGLATERNARRAGFRLVYTKPVLTRAMR